MIEGDGEDDDPSRLAHQRDRLRDAVARAEEDRVEIARYHATVAAGQNHGRQLPRWLPPALRLLVGAAVGVALAFLIAYSAIHGAFG